MTRLMLSILLLFTSRVCAGAVYTMESGDLQRHNRALAPSGLSAPLHPEWISSACVGEPSGGPVVLEDRVIQAFRTGVRCVARNNGTALWTWPSGPVGWIWNAPVYDQARNMLYQGACNGALLWMDPNDGHVVHTFYEGCRPGNLQYSAPLFVNDRIYCGTGGGSFVCLDPDTYAVLWRYDFPSTEGTCTPAYEGGNIYLSTAKGRVYCLRESDGALQWKVDAASGQIAGVLVEGNYLYTMLGKGQVQCRSKTDGHLVWSYQTESWAGANLASCGDLLIAASDDRYVYALELSTGQLVWKRHFTGNFARSSPFVVCDIIYVSGCANHYYALDGRTGNTVWDYDEGFDNTFVDWAEADSQLFTADRSGRIYRFESDTPGDPLQCACDLSAWTFTPTPVQSPTDSPTGTYTSTPTPQFSATPTLTPSPVYSDTFSPTISLTSTPTPSRTISSTYSPSQTFTSTPTPSPTRTISPTFTVSDTLTFSPTSSLTRTVSPTYSVTDTFTFSPTATRTRTLSATYTVSDTFTYSPTQSPSFTESPTQSFTLTPTTPTPTFTPTMTPTTAPPPEPGDGGTYVFPDPVHAGKPCKVAFHSDRGGKATLRVFKANGAEAYRDETSFGSPGTHFCDIDTSSLASGVYFYTVEVSDDQDQRKRTGLSKFIVIQ